MVNKIPKTIPGIKEFIPKYTYMKKGKNRNDAKFNDHDLNFIIEMFFL